MFNRAIANEVMGGSFGGLLEQKVDLKTLQSGLSRLQVMKGTVGGFQKTLDANLDQALQLSKQVGRTGSSLANDYILYTQGRLQDYPELSRFRVAVNTAANEYARITNSATGGGVSTDSARGEAMSLLNTGMAEGSFDGAVQQMRIDANNRVTQGIDQPILEMQGQIRNLGTTPPAQTPGTAPGSLDEALDKAFGKKK